jgi:hypothetical protein
MTEATSTASIIFADTPFDSFLFAVVGQNKNGMNVTVLSALAGLNFDPWEKAAELSRLPSNEAGNRLASLISELPDLLSVTPEPARIDQLIGLLPAGRVVGRFRRSFGFGIFASARTVAIYVVLLAMILGAQQLWVNAQLRGQIASHHLPSLKAALSSTPLLK